MNVDNNIPLRRGIYLCFAILRYSLCSNPIKQNKSNEVLIDHNSLGLQAVILLPNSEL